jgi:O-acetylhomoserine (thiol)-lyase
MPCSKSASPRSKAASARSPVASGQAALHLAIATLMGAGGHIVASRSLYGGSHNLLDYTCRASASPPPSSIRATSTPGAPRSGPRRRLLFGETLGNPGLDVLDIPAVARSPTSTACRCWWTAPSPRPG